MWAHSSQSSKLSKDLTRVFLRSNLRDHLVQQPERAIGGKEESLDCEKLEVSKNNFHLLKLPSTADIHGEFGNVSLF